MGKILLFKIDSYWSTRNRMNFSRKRCLRKKIYECEIKNGIYLRFVHDLPLIKFLQ